MRKVLAILLIAVLAVSFVSCNRENGFMKKYKDYEKTVDYLLLCNFETEDQPVVVDAGNVVGVTFELEKDTCLNEITAFFNGFIDGKCERVATIYKLKDDYAKTVKSRPVAKAVVATDDGYSRTTFKFEEGAVGEGSYLCTFSMSDNQTANIMMAFPDESGRKSYVYGCENSKAPRAYITFNRYVKPSENEPALTKLTPGKSHVIILTGQSNASGQSYTKFVKDSDIPKDAIEKAEKGFDNVLIKGDPDNRNEITKFVPVTFGQGGGTDRFGPEVGLAYALSEKYPDETFYILKYSWSGAGLTKHFQDTNAEWKYMSSQIKSALKKMEKDGMDPEVFAVLWMQGETDSWYALDTLTYADKQEDFINRVKKLIDGYEAPNGFSFLDAAISNSGCWTYNNLINTQKQICDARNPNWYYVDTLAEDLNCLKENNDIAHYDSYDQFRLGEMFGETIIKVIEK